MEIFVHEANGSRIFFYSFVKLDKMWKRFYYANQAMKGSDKDWF